MKAIAYNIKSEEKECLVLANHKKHDITIIANSLCFETLAYAQGKEAFIVFNEDPLDEKLIKGLKAMGIKYIATSTSSINNIDLDALVKYGIKLANVPLKASEPLALDRMHQIVDNLDKWASGVCLGEACCHPVPCENKPSQFKTRLC